MQKGNSIPLILLGVIILTISALVWFKTSKQNPLPTATTPQTNQKSVASRVGNWQTFINSKFNYSIDYPEVLSPEKGSKTSDVVYFGKQIFISVANANQTCLGDCPTEQIEKTDNVTLLIGPAIKTVGKRAATQAGGYLPPQSFERYEIIKNSNKYTLEITELEYDAGFKADAEKMFPTDRKPGLINPQKLVDFEQMVESFKVL